MANNIDRQYLELVNHILRFGYDKKDRTGTGTKSIFDWNIRHRMSEGFPLLTTKKIAWKTMVTELLWFLRGDTNIKYLVDNGCHIWDGDCYQAYLNQFKLSSAYPMSKEQFIESIKTDNEFAKKWGDLGPVYGKQWRSWESYDFVIDNDFGNNAFGGGWDVIHIDQIADAINLLKTDPDSRRNMVSAWNVADLPVTDYRTDDELYEDYLKQNK